METSTASKVNQAISDLEILKDRIASITARYNILNEDYTRLCEDAIAVIAEYRTDEIPAGIQAADEAPFVEVAPENLPAAAEIVSPVPIAEMQPAGCPSGDTAIPLAEQKLAAYKALGPAGESLGSMEGLDVKVSRAPSLEEIIAFQQRQLYAEANVKTRKPSAKKKVSAQSVVDMIGDGIESGLDKLGNGIMFPFVKIADLSKKRTASRLTGNPSEQH
jgi:hypothetical protein